MTDDAPGRTPGRIDYLEFATRDPQATKDFFAALCGWSFTDWGEEYVSFEDGRLDGGLRRSDVTASIDSGAALAVLYADDLEAMRDRVLELGGSIVEPIFAFPGGRRFHFRAPGGCELAAWTESPAPDEDGR